MVRNELLTHTSGAVEPLTSSADFNITGPASGAGLPAFLAYCSGGVEGAPFDQCEVLDKGDASRRVAAKLQAVNTAGTGAHLAVSYQFQDPTQT